MLRFNKKYWDHIPLRDLLNNLQFKSVTFSWDRFRTWCSSCRGACSRRRCPRRRPRSAEAWRGNIWENVPCHKKFLLIAVQAVAAPSELGGNIPLVAHVLETHGAPFKMQMLLLLKSGRVRRRKKPFLALKGYETFMYALDQEPSQQRQSKLWTS